MASSNSNSPTKGHVELSKVDPSGVLPEQGTRMGLGRTYASELSNAALLYEQALNWLSTVVASAVEESEKSTFLNDCSQKAEL